MKKIIIFSSLIIFLLYVITNLFIEYLSVFTSSSFVYQIEKSKNNTQISDILNEGINVDDIEMFGGMNSSGKFFFGDYSIEFFHPSKQNFNYYCKEGGYCGMAPDMKSYECDINVDCDVVLIVSDLDGNIVLKGFGGWSYNPGDELEPNTEIFPGVVKLEKMPKDFPYLVLKGRGGGNCCSGYFYDLYDAKNQFKKIYELGSSDDGFYKNTKGNYIINVHSIKARPEGGDQASVVGTDIPFRMVGEQEYAKTGELFVIDMDAIEARLVDFSDDEINKMMSYAKKSNKKIVKTFEIGDLDYIWSPDSQSKKWPLALLWLRESDPDDGYVYWDLFKFIANGRVDLAKQYFDLVIPEKYNQFKEILPQNLNTRSKLWKGYLNDLKEQVGWYWATLEHLNRKYNIL